MKLVSHYLIEIFDEEEFCFFLFFFEKRKKDFLHKENSQYKGVTAWKTLVDLKDDQKFGCDSWLGGGAQQGRS